MTCPACDSENIQLESYSDAIAADGRAVQVDDLRRYVCGTCGCTFADDTITRHNLVRVQLALGEEPRYILPDMIRAWRESLGLTQREAARILGGGVNAFSKYETGEVVPADAMDNLLWLCMREPSLLAALADRRNVPVPAGLLAKYRPEQPVVAVSAILQGNLKQSHRTSWQLDEGARTTVTVAFVSANEAKYRDEAAIA